MLSNEQKKLLEQIMLDKFSNGAFCGMIFNIQQNALIQGQVVSTESLIIQALNIRLKAMEMIE